MKRWVRRRADVRKWASERKGESQQRREKPEKDCQGEGGEQIFFFPLCSSPEDLHLSLFPLSLSLFSASNRDSLVMFPPPASFGILF